jgi:hypothetical protein
MSLKAQFKGNYKKRTLVNGESKLITVFTYNVNGTEEELKEYEEAQGEYYQIDDKTGKPLFFTTNYTGNSIDLIISPNGKVVADTSEFDKLKALVDSYGEATTRLMMQKGLI